MSRAIFGLRLWLLSVETDISFGPFLYRSLLLLSVILILLILLILLIILIILISTIDIDQVKHVVVTPLLLQLHNALPLASS